ncbi:MAG: DUF4397 domain-containing protein [Chitinophagaceae bacterium]|nr:DUF4397 domain-containing protein [Chitinophagaceae bacterium]
MKLKNNISFLFAALVLISIAGCQKTKEATELNPLANSTAQFIHAAPDTLAILPQVQPAYDIVVDGLVANGSRRLTYGLVSAGGGGGNGAGYMPFLEGTRNIKISRDSGRTNVIEASLPFAKNSAYTIIAYDTLATPSSKLKVVRLNDNLTVPATGFTHVRFVHAAPNAPAVDITFLRTVPSLDSVTITNRSYLGASPNADALSAFTPVPSGTYTMKIKAAGTQTVVATVSLGTNLASGRIFTYYAIGTAQRRPLAVINTRHF